MKVKDKYVVCISCHKGYTINFKEKDIEKKCICPYCKKLNIHIIKKKK